MRQISIYKSQLFFVHPVVILTFISIRAMRINAQDLAPMVISVVRIDSISHHISVALKGRQQCVLLFWFVDLFLFSDEYVQQ